MTSSETDKIESPDKPDPASAGRFAAGQVIAERFVVIRYIDRGGMGEVYEVEDRFLQKVHVALKIIAPEIAGDTSSSHRFEREVLLARKVVHPNLCPIYDIARCEDPAPPFLFLTMKLVDGETLSARLKRGPIPREETITIFRQLVAGLAAIHAAGVIHRDIKPNNVMLESSGPELCVSIMDFGLARLDDPEATVATQTQMAGALGYMAPEILRGQGPSTATDLFALGVVLHQLLTCERPYQGAISYSVEPTAKLAKADVPPAFIQAVKDFLSNDPEKRCAAFEQLKTSLSITTSGQHWAADGNSGRKRLTRRQLAIGSAATAIAAAGGVVWKWDRIYDLTHPLPPKRFVALVGWPVPTDPRVEPAVTSVVNAIGTELARAEAFDRNLYIIPHRVGKEVASMAQINEMREILGANLVLSASAAIAGEEVHLLLRVLDSSKTLREKSMTTPVDDLLSLPDRAVRVAANLLNVVKLEVDDQRLKGGTNNPEAYAAFQKAEASRAQPNDAGVEASVAFYKQAIDLDPNYALANANLAIAYFRLYILHRNQGHLQLVRANAESALAKNPNLVEGHLAMAFALGWTGDNPGALREISKALALDPHNPVTLLIQGQEFTQLNRWSDAEETFLRLQTLRANYWLGHNELGVAYSDEGKYANAAEQFRAAGIAGSNRSLPLSNLSAALLHMGDLDGALDAARKCLALGPNHDGEAMMAAVLRCQGKPDEALSHAQKSVVINPDDPDHWMDLGDSYSLVRGRQAAARDAYEKAVKLQESIVHTDPTEGPAWMALALAQAKTNRPEESIKSVKLADNNFAGDMDSQLAKVRTLVLLGMQDEAIATASACLGRGATAFQFKCMPDIDSLRNDLKFKGLLSSLPA